MNDTPEPEVLNEQGVAIMVLGEQFESLDERKVEGLNEAFLSVAQAADPPLVAVDLSHTTFFGSAFIELLFRTWNRLNARDGKLAICGLQGYCVEVIDVAHLDQLWLVRPTRAEAVSALLAAGTSRPG